MRHTSQIKSRNSKQSDNLIYNRRGRGYLHNKNIVPELQYFRFDGIHLSAFGKLINAVFLNAMLVGLKQFITTNKSQPTSESRHEGFLNLEDCGGSGCRCL